MRASWPLPAPLAAYAAGLVDYQAGRVGFPRLHILVVDSVVADQRVGQGHDLPVVGGVGQDFLIARHGGIEDELAVHLAFAGKGATGE